MAKPPCPVWGTNKQVNSHGRDEFFCGKCGGLFDSNPDEGGSYYSDPSKRLEKQEERLQIQRQRNQRRY